jgi:hypothetical protein
LDAAITRTSDPERVLAADALERLLLERAQHLRLRLEAHVADLVQEERAAVGQLELAVATRQRSGEGALLVAEQLGLDQLFRDRGAVDLDERALAPHRLDVNGARDQLLAAAVLAVDQHAPVGGRGGRDLLAKHAHRGALADDLGALLEARAQRGVLALEARVLERAADRDQDLLERERLLDEVVRAQARRLHRGLDGAVAGDHDHNRLGPCPLDLGEGLEAVHPVHPDVEERDVRQLVGEEPERVGAAADRGHAVALVLQHIAEGRADRGFVVDY